MQQKISEWEINDKREQQYHLGQYERPYRSTEIFIKWLDEKIKKSSTVCDMACGGGANLYYLADKYPNVHFKEIDIVQNNIDIAKKHLNHKRNASVQQGDLYNLSDELINKFSGIICFQTLSWLPEYRNALKSLAKLNTQWMAFSSLLYDGHLEYKIEVSDYTRKDNQLDCMSRYYNIYSIPRLKKYFNELGYHDFQYTKFEIDIDIEKSISDGLGTYTQKLENGNRIQISGGLMLPWYFILASK